jgi:hypothetical protein
MGEGKELALFSLTGVVGREELRQDNGGSELKSLETVLFSGLLIKMFDMMWWNRVRKRVNGGLDIENMAVFICKSEQCFFFGVVLTHIFP